VALSEATDSILRLTRDFRGGATFVRRRCVSSRQAREPVARGAVALVVLHLPRLRTARPSIVWADPAASIRAPPATGPPPAPASPPTTKPTAASKPTTATETTSKAAAAKAASAAKAMPATTMPTTTTRLCGREAGGHGETIEDDQDRRRQHARYKLGRSATCSHGDLQNLSGGRCVARTRSENRDNTLESDGKTMCAFRGLRQSTGTTSHRSHNLWDDRSAEVNSPGPTRP
jgi:hypothetical protein